MTVAPQCFIIATHLAVTIVAWPMGLVVVLVVVGSVQGQACSEVMSAGLTAVGLRWGLVWRPETPTDTSFGLCSSQGNVGCFMTGGKARGRLGGVEGQAALISSPFS